MRQGGAAVASGARRAGRRRRIAVALGGVAVAALSFACAGQRGARVALEGSLPDYEWRLPAGFPEPPVPRDNPMTAEKVELGRRLFYDRRLSGNGHFACASCHRQELAFTDGLPRAVGSTGELHPRSSMSLANVAYNATYNWADPTLVRLEDQALNPMLNEEPVELGMAGVEEEVFERLRSDEALVERFARAFPGEPVSLDTVSRAIAAFERTLISGDSPYDRYLFFDEPLPGAAARGKALFFSERTRCSECHAGLNLSGPVRSARAAPNALRGPAETPSTGPSEGLFHNTGLFDEDGAGAYPAPNRGVFEVTGRSEDMGRFRAPTLRNIEVTGPYMHDGSIATLEDVVAFYVAGGRGAGRRSPLKSKLVSGLDLDLREQADLVAFLEALTDRSFLTDPRFASPDDSGSEVEADAGRVASAR